MRTTERIDGNQDRPNVRVNLTTLPPFFQVFVYAFIADCC